MATVLALSCYLGGQKVIIETHHQPVTFLNSQRIREGVVTNARVVSQLMALQSYDTEVREAQNHKGAPAPPIFPTSLSAQPMLLKPSHHHYFDENACQEKTTVYMDGSSFQQVAQNIACVGIVWVNDSPCERQGFNLGSQTSQYAEVAGILITLQMVVAAGVQTLVICKDFMHA